jgi:hypothetical protein
VISPASSSSSETAAPPTYRANDENDWKFIVSVNPWFLFMAGDLTVLDQSGPIDINFGQLWTQLHMAVMADVEVQKGDFGVFTDISWARLWQRTYLPRAVIETDIDWVLFDFAVYWEALSLKLGSGKLPPRLRLQPYFGARYQYFGTEMDINPVVGRDRRIAPTSNAAAPILGLRAFLDIDEHWNMSFAADGGGFGVDSVDVTWHAELMAGYRFRLLTKADFNLLVGYKAVGVDVRSGSKDIETDLIYHGPVLSIGADF